MTSSGNINDFLNDILENIEKVEAFIAGMSLDNFLNDDKTAYATIRAIEIIGEAVKQIPEDIRQQYPNIPWREIGRMRDKLIHHYFNINLRIVWKTIQQDIEPLKTVVQQILKDLPGKEKI